LVARRPEHRLTAQYLAPTKTTMTLKKIDHEFKNNALSYDATPNYQPCIKLSFFFNKKPEVSDEQFHRYSTLNVYPRHLLTLPPVD